MIYIYIYIIVSFLRINIHKRQLFGCELSLQGVDPLRLHGFHGRHPFPPHWLPHLLGL